MIIGTPESYKMNHITVAELFAVVKAAAQMPTCVQYKGVLHDGPNWSYVDFHLYGMTTLGCTYWTDERGPVRYTARNFKTWTEVKSFIGRLVTSK